MDSNSKENKKICIVGSGLVGALLATLLSQAGFKVDIYEKRSDPRKNTKCRGRSIALNLSDRGWKALKQAGLEEAIRENTKPAFGRVIHQKDGSQQYQDYGDGEQAIWTVNRHYLNTVLLEKAVETGKANFYFGYDCETLDEKSGQITFINSESKEKVKKHYDHIIGVDGAFSSVRKNLLDKKLCEFENFVFDFGYKELTISSNSLGENITPDNRTHIWPRENSVLLAFPTKDGSFVSTIFIPQFGYDSFETLTTPELFREFFEREYKDILPFMKDLEKDFSENPNSTITQVKGGPWNYEDKVLLMGDASHAISPFYGMGMNIGFEDCTVFMNLLKDNNYNFEISFKLLGKIRKPNTDAMTELSYENFKSINESPDPAYQTKWLLERRIWKLFPKHWTPIYQLITSSDKPLAKVPAIKKYQNSVIDKLVEFNKNILELSDEDLRIIVREFISPIASKRKIIAEETLSVIGSLIKYFKSFKRSASRTA